MSATVLVQGASGFIGRNVLSHASALSSRGIRAVGLSRGDDLRERIDAARSAGDTIAVVNCAGLADLARSEKEPDEATRANAELPERMARVCREANATFVHVSSDGIFPNGRRPEPAYWSPNDVPDPVTAYGRSKWDGERRIEAMGWGHVVRLAPVGGDAGTGRGLVAFLAGRHREAIARDAVLEVPGFSDIWFTPSPLRELSLRLLVLAAETDGGHSVRHWGTETALTKADLLARLTKAAQLQIEIKFIRRVEQPNSHLVPLDQSLCCTQPWTLDELIASATRDLRELLHTA